MLRTVFDSMKTSGHISLTLHDIGMKFSPEIVIILLSLHFKNFEFMDVDNLNVKPHHVVDLSALKTISSVGSCKRTQKSGKCHKQAGLPCKLDFIQLNCAILIYCCLYDESITASM
uniref:Uncharacterized protein n=1 Tax=Glossina austeni TaxID=7395 RepID=A0A1A9UWR0_GLOAU